MDAAHAQGFDFDPALGHDPFLHAALPADVKKLDPGVELSQGLGYGEGREYVPPGAAARYQYPHGDPQPASRPGLRC